MSTVIGVAAAALLLILLFIFFLVYAYKSGKGCFKQKGSAFERDANFHIYPNNEPYIVREISITCIRTSFLFILMLNVGFFNLA